MLSVSQDANLGLATVALASGTGGQTHTAGSPSDVRLRGGVLQSTGTFTTARSLIFTLASGIDVTGGNALTVSSPTLGAFALTKIGSGTLALNSDTNATTNLTIGGFAGGGGTVSTTAVSGTPFGTAASTITINSGTLSLIGSAGAQAITTASLEFRGGSYIQINKGAGTSANSGLCAALASVRISAPWPK